MFVDSHCHLVFPELRAQLDSIRTAMAQAQVDRALCICTTLEEFADVHALATGYDNFWATVGVHPDNEDVQEPTLADLLERGALPRVVGIGETGLDYHWCQGDLDWQHRRFITHIEAAKQSGLPLIVHTRDAGADTLRLLSEEQAQAGVIHCFTEDVDFARKALDLGFYISFSGIVSFKSAQALRDVAAYVPLERLLIETDSPYLAPVPYRGKTNQPAYVAMVADCLAQVRHMPLEALAEASSRNFDQLFFRT